MPLNDRGNDEFDNKIDDESVYPVPAVEIGGDVGNVVFPGIDRGSGSYAEDGRLEVAEDNVMLDGETLGGGPASEDGQSEIGEDEVGDWSVTNVDEVGDDEVGDDEIGSAAMYGQTEIGDDEMGAAEAADREGSEIGGSGNIAVEGQTEIGRANSVMPFEAFMLEETRMGEADTADREHLGSAAMYGQTEIGDDDEIGDDEMGAAEAADREGSEIGVAHAVAKVIEKARDNRQPPPPMRAVDVEAPTRDEDEDWGLTDVVIGAAAATGTDPFPLTSQLLLRCGAGGAPRYVRVDTEESYKKFRAENSPEMAALSARLEAHIADPHAHEHGDELSSDLSDDIDDLVHLGAAVDAAEKAKRVELWMPRRFDGLVTAWREGDFVCASMTLPGADGEVRICTSLEPIAKCVEEMSRHAAESGVPASTVVGVLPAMGCVLGAGTVLKEMAAAAPSILQRKEAVRKAPFVVRIEPKTSPALAALAMLAWACRQGNAQACAEWKALGEISAGPVKQAMAEALAFAKTAA